MSWVEALRETILEYHDAPIVWGEFDCCQFAAAYYNRVTGENIAESFQYESELGATRILRKYKDISGLFHHLLGESSDLKPGSIVLTSISDEGDLIAAGVYSGYCVFAVHPDRGLVRFTPNRITEAWTV